MSEKYCSVCDDCEGEKCKICWIGDMIQEIDEAPTYGEETKDVPEET